MRLLPFLLLLSAAAPAAAQIVGHHVYGPVARPSPFLGDSRLPSPSPRSDVRDVRERIDAAREAGRISAREARQLRREANLIARLGERYGRDGLSDSERQELEVRAAALRAATNRR
jgi:hypothetical protein